MTWMEPNIRFRPSAVWFLLAQKSDRFWRHSRGAVVAVPRFSRWPLLRLAPLIITSIRVLYGRPLPCGNPGFSWDRITGVAGALLRSITNTPFVSPTCGRPKMPASSGFPGSQVWAMLASPPRSSLWDSCPSEWHWKHLRSKNGSGVWFSWE